MNCIRLLIRKLTKDDRGADLVEYALLTGLIGIVGVAIFPNIQAKMAAAFSSWGTTVHDTLWIPKNPI